MYRRFLSIVRIACETIIYSPFQIWDNESHSTVYQRHDTVDDHCLHDLEADILEPIWLVVVERTIEKLGDEERVVLRQVRIHNQNQEACVKELGQEHFVRNRRLLLTSRVLADPNHKLDNDNLQDDINGNDDERNGLAHQFRHQDIAKVLLTNRPVVDHVAPHS